MMRTSFFFLFLFLFFNLPQAFALSCGNRLVNLGDKKVEVLLKCGEPALVERWEDTIIAYRDFQGAVIKGSAIHRYVEEWTYNFGPNRFLYFLRFTDDKLSNIEQGSRGFNGPLPSKGRKTSCGKMVEVGDRKIDVLMKCGPPDLREERYEERLHSILGDRDRIFEEHQYRVGIEEWTYNFGPNYFLYFIRFENGRVRRVEPGDYGY